MIDELRELVKRSEVSRCLVGNWLESQDKEVQQLLDQLRNNPRVNKTELLRVLQSSQANLPFKRTAFEAHMKGICACQIA